MIQPERIREPNPNAEDEAYDNARQRELDHEMEAKRRASGLSPEQLSIQDAFIEGGKAGRANQSASLNPYQYGIHEHNAWERGRSGAVGYALNHERANKARIA